MPELVSADRRYVGLVPSLSLEGTGQQESDSPPRFIIVGGLFLQWPLVGYVLFIPEPRIWDAGRRE